jgi:hypothetical protein
MDGEEAVLHVRDLLGANPTRLEEKEIVFHVCKLYIILVAWAQRRKPFLRVQRYT